MEPNSKKILYVEDEVNVGTTLKERLEAEGYEVEWQRSRAGGLEAARNQTFHLALLDIALPDGTGFQIAEELRKRNVHTSIVFLTAFGTPEDRVRGLELGAEDYIPKPFHLKELLLRLRNVLKRTQSFNENPELDGVQLGRTKIFFSRLELELENETVKMTQKEAALLQLLLVKKDRVVSRDEILNTVWAQDEFPTPRTIDNFILKLRKWIEIEADNPRIIQSVRGVGYLLKSETQLEKEPRT
jgi:two-component system alkaline phosphatase synthesis response regulator PhoP